MEPIQALALSKFSIGRVRDEVEPGEYDVNVLVRVKGSVKVGEDYSQRIVAAANPWKLLAVALSKLNGVTVDSIVREAEANGLDDKAVKTQADAAIQTIKEPTERTCSGKVTAKGLTFNVVASTHETMDAAAAIGMMEDAAA